MKHYPPKPKPRGNGWSHWRDRTEQARFRAMLIQRDGLHCRICGRTDIELQAHHDTPTDGRMLCRKCHRDIDPHAR